MSIIERVSSGQGYIVHYVGYIWDSVCVHYRERVLLGGVCTKRGSIVIVLQPNIHFFLSDLLSFRSFHWTPMI